MVDRAALQAAEEWTPRLDAVTMGDSFVKLLAEAFEAYITEQTAALRAQIKRLRIALITEHAENPRVPREGEKCAVCDLLADPEGQRAGEIPNPEKVWAVVDDVARALHEWCIAWNRQHVTKQYDDRAWADIQEEHRKAHYDVAQFVVAAVERARQEPRG